MENTGGVIHTEAASRYSVEANYRTKTGEVLESFAKITLGYVSAAIKQNGYHVKHVYEQKPLRIIIGTRAFDDGEWAVVVSFNPDHHFVVSKGFYNADRKTVSVQSSHKCKGDSAAEITGEVRNMLHGLKGEKDRRQLNLKAVPQRRGPKG